MSDVSRETGIGEVVAKAMEALNKAERQFTLYAEHHKQQADIPGTFPGVRAERREKAATNYGYATMCGDALEHLKLYFERKAEITQALGDLVAMRKAR